MLVCWVELSATLMENTLPAGLIKDLFWAGAGATCSPSNLRPTGNWSWSWSFCSLFIIHVFFFIHSVFSPVVEL